MEITRDIYVERLKMRMHNRMIKIITGIRRSGKSYLLFTLFYRYLRESGVAEDQIICINLEDRQSAFLRDPDTFLSYVAERRIDAKNYYLFIDEVQLLVDFESVLNGLMRDERLDIYVTGSNSRFLSRDVATEFRGRGDELHVFPLSFAEFMSAYQGDVYQGLAEYFLYGGLPALLMLPTDEQKVSYLQNLFTTTYIKDLHERYGIAKKQEFDDLINILASQVGSLSNPSRIVNTFSSVLKSDISLNTLKSYIDYLREAFIINEAYRYDVRGKKYIGTPLKYYFEDLGLRNAKLNFRQQEDNHLMENLIYNELRLRGYQVDVGVITRRQKDEDGRLRSSTLEVDFIASQGSKLFYIQSALVLPTSEKRAQEKASLLAIGDAFTKIIIVKDAIKAWRDEDGILTMSLYDFLLNPDSLHI